MPVKIFVTISKENKEINNNVWHVWGMTFQLKSLKSWVFISNILLVVQHLHENEPIKNIVGVNKIDTNMFDHCALTYNSN